MYWYNNNTYCCITGSVTKFKLYTVHADIETTYSNACFEQESVSLWLQSLFSWLETLSLKIASNVTTRTCQLAILGGKLKIVN